MDRPRVWFRKCGVRYRLLAASALAAMAAANPALAQSRLFAIPEEPAAKGIADFAKQAGVQILVPASLTAGKRTNAVSGSLPIREALSQLLAGDNLAIVYTDGRTITLGAQAPLTRISGEGQASPAAASPPPSPPPADTSEVIVTGTRSTSRTATNSLAPIDVITAADLEKSGKTSTRDLISTLIPSANTSNSGAGASFAIKTLSLRGLSGDQTLVLVNGKRRHDTAILFVNGTTQNGQSPTDIDLIPADMIARIEVLRDGASAQYGSDAIAGVVNIITKSADHGGDAFVQYGQTAYGDGGTTEASANMGFKLGDGGFLNLTGDFRFQGLTDRGARALNETQLYAKVNGQPDPSEATADRHTAHPGQPQIQLFTMGYDAGIPITPDIQFYSFGTASSRDSAAWLTFRNPNSSNNNTAVYPNGYSPRLFLHDRDFQVTAGFKGDQFFGFHWDLSTSYSQDDVDYYTSSLNASLGPASPTYFYVGELRVQESTTNFDLTREISTGWFAKPTFVAAGLEFRDNTFSIGAGEPDSYINGGYVAPAGTPLAGVVTTGGSQGVTGFPPFSAGNFERNNVSAYVNIEQPLTSRWDVSLAGRYEHYSDFGDAETGKISSRYEILSWLALRGTINSGFRAPSLQQEHYASSSTIGVALPQGTVLYPVQLLPPTNPAAQALGASPLKPETSMNYSIGFVAKPIPRMNVTLDLYQVDIDNRILQSGTLGPSTAVSAALQSQGLNPQQAVFYYGNFADTTTRGIDLVVDYRTDLGEWGKVKWTGSGNWNTNEFDKILVSPKLAALGLTPLSRSSLGDFTTGQPANKIIASADWTYDRFDSVLRITDWGKIVQRGAVAANDQVMRPIVLVDLDITAHLTRSIDFTIGANNLLNKYPAVLKPVNQGTPPFSYYEQYEPFGQSGGFYYVKVSGKF